MFDQASRSLWLEDQLWPKLREAFPDLRRLPEQVLITVGYPASGARGRSEKIKPAEINFQWQGNANEKAFISVHPMYFDTPLNVAMAIAFQGHKETRGARWGPSLAGLSKDDKGKLHATPETQTKLDVVLADVGEPPPGFGVPFPVRTVQRARLRKYKAPCGQIVRAATDTLTAVCLCEDCGDHGGKFELA